MRTGLIILAGGKSSRMGRNKALLPLKEDKTVIESIITRLVPKFAPPILVTNEPELYRWMNVSMTADLFPGKGPLAGIHAGLHASACEVNLIVACDMPFVSSTVGEFLVGVADGYDAVVPQLKKQLHPLFALYRKSCLAVIEQCLSNNKLRMVDFLNLLKVRYVVESELLALDMMEDPFMNMNHPEEYVSVLEKLKKQDKKNHS